MKITKENAREKFRRTCNIQEINTLPDLDPDYEYKDIDVSTQREGINRLYRYQDAGWEVVYAKEKVQDDRSMSHREDNKKEELRETPVTYTTKSGHTMVRMRCLKAQRNKNETTKREKRLARLRQMQKSIKQEGRHIKMVGHEINSNNFKSSEDI